MKKIIIIISLLIISVSKLKTVNANDYLVNKAKSAILIDTQTNTILYEKNSQNRLSMASMTKVMTLSIIYDEIKANRLNVEDEITTTQHAKEMGGSQVYLEVGEKHKLKELLKCICISSANDAAVAVAEHISGNELEFVGKMNKKAKDLNMLDTKYLDATGLSDENYTTAHDMAIIGSYLVTNYEEVLDYTSLKEDYFRKDTDNPFWLVNTNKLVGRNVGVDGLKTGWTNKAGYCLTATMKKDNMRLLSVVMGYDNPIVRNNESLELLNYGFSNFKLIKVIDKNIIYKSLDNILYANNKVELISKEDKFYIVNKLDNAQITTKIKYNLNDKNNQGIVDVFLNNDYLFSTNLYIKDIKKKNIAKLFLDIIFKSLM